MQEMKTRSLVSKWINQPPTDSLTVDIGRCRA